MVKRAHHLLYSRDLVRTPSEIFYCLSVMHELLKGQLYALDTQVRYDSGRRT
jgi:hypothetical protein